MLTLETRSGAILAASASLQSNPGSGGLLITIFNNSVKGQFRRMSSAVFNEVTGQFAIADENGSVFNFSLVENRYSTLQISSIPVSAMTFVHSRRDQIVIAYENGVVILMDTITQKILGNILKPTAATARIMRCHPSKPMLALGSEDGAISLWDLRSMQCTRHLNLSEGVVDLSFCLDGELVSIAVENTGVFLYRSTDCFLSIQCLLPLSERQCRWTCCVTRYTRSRSAPSPFVVNMTVFAAADNGMIYVWNVSSFDIRSRSKETLVATLIGVIELPVQTKMAVKMTCLGDTECAPRIAILSSDGSLLIFDIENLTPSSVGTCTIVSDLRPDQLQGISLGDVIEPFSIRASNQCQGRDGIFTTKDDLIVVIGIDGGARLIDSELALGSGLLCGSLLRSRAPHLRDRRVTNDFDGREGKKKKTLTAPKKAAVINNNSNNSNIYTETSAGETSTASNGVVQHKNDKNEQNKINKRTDGKLSKHPRKQSLARTSRSNINSGVNVDNLALFELAGITPQDKRVNDRKLKAYLLAHGEFPDRYRALIWRFLLKLPENSTAFSDLVRRGVHPAYEDLFERYPVRARRTFSRLQGVCSQLANWSAIFAETSYIPTLVFPFIIVFGADELAALETVMTILMWWGFSWHATFPNPPIHVVDSIDTLLKLHDSKLHHHLHSIDVAPGLLGWAMISSIFSEVLCRSDWLRLMDFMFLNFEKSAVILITPVVIIGAMKNELMNSNSEEYIFQFCRRQQPLNMESITKSISDILFSTSGKYFTAVARPEDETQEKLLSSIPVELDHIEQTRESVANTMGMPSFPLGKGRYPAYDGYPKYLVDWQLRDRDHAMALHNEISRREDVLHQLERKITQIDDDNKLWMLKHEAATEAEVRHKRMVVENEKNHMKELQRIEEEISQQRMKTLNSLESAAVQEMDVLDRVAIEAREMLNTGELHMREKISLSLNLQKHRELAVVAESETHDRIRQIHLRRSRDEWVKGIEGSLRSKEDELHVRDAMIAEKWKQEDEENQLRRTMTENKTKRQNEELKLAQMREEMSSRLQLLCLEREAKISEIERSRAVQLSKEQADEAIAAANRSMLILQRHELAVSKEQAAKLAEKSVGLVQNKILKTVDLIRDESTRLLEAERSHVLKFSSLKQRERETLLQQAWEDQQGNQLQSIILAERDLQDHLLQLHKASAVVDARQNIDMRMSDQAYMDHATKGDASTLRRMQQLDDDSTQHQRDSFRDFRQTASGRLETADPRSTGKYANDNDTKKHAHRESGGIHTDDSEGNVDVDALLSRLSRGDAEKAKGPSSVTSIASAVAQSSLKNLSLSRAGRREDKKQDEILRNLSVVDDSLYAFSSDED